MIAFVGNLGLLGALACAVVSLLIALFGSWSRSGRFGRAWFIGAVMGTFASFAVAAGALLAALWRVDLRFAYVAAHTSRSLEPIFRLASFWSGQEGSLLMWALFGSGVGLSISLVQRRSANGGDRGTMVTVPAINGFFAVMLLFAASPFKPMASAINDGFGLHPQLRHWAMIAHPPMIFAGYSLAAAPFAITMGAFFSQRRDGEWVRRMRRWAVGAWVFLTAGIAIGAWWSYVELGWGGYWAWDPVENASLMPWLTCTALLHAMLVHEHGGAIKSLCGLFALVTFILCVFGAFLTRSGVVQSIHSFASSSVGWIFLIALAGTTVASIVATARAGPAWLSASSIELGVNRGTAVLIGVVLASVLAFTTIVGTSLPLLSRAFSDVPVSVGSQFYDRVFAPLGLGAAALMAIAPVLSYQRSRRIESSRIFAVAGIAGALITVLAWCVGTHNPGVLLCLFVGAVAAFLIVAGLVESIRSCALHSGQPLMRTTVMVVRANRRRYGGHLAHLGFALLLIGVAGSQLLAVVSTSSLKIGESMAVGPLTLRLEGFREFREGDHVSVEATLAVSRPDSTDQTLRPQRRFYVNVEEPTAEVALNSTWREDVYVAIVGWEDITATAAIEARINPLTAWIWIGAGLMATGGVLSVMPRPVRLAHASSAMPGAGRTETRGFGAGGTPVFADWKSL